MTRAAQGRAVELQRELRDLLCLAVGGDRIRWVRTEDDGELAEWPAEAVSVLVVRDASSSAMDLR